MPNNEGEFQPWDEESIQKFEQLARHAVGFSEERGDRITVTNAPFRSFSAEETSPGFSVPQGVSGIVEHAIRVVGLVLALILFSRLVVKPLADTLRTSGDGSTARLDALEERLVAAGAISEVGESGALATPAAPGQQLAANAARQSDQSLQAIRSWLREH